MLRIFRIRIVRRIYGPIMKIDIWRSRYNRELYELHNEPDMGRWDGGARAESLHQANST
jgi:hypothetical protein